MNSMRYLLILSVVLLAASCTSKLEKRLTAEMIEAPSNQEQKDKNAILKFALANEMNVQSTLSGIYYVLEEEGEGERTPTMNDQIVAHYRGQLLDGKEFDSSYKRDDPLKFGLGGVIKGWQEAIPLLKKGGKGTFLIPSDLAYGKRGAGQDIPPNSVLRFDIELIDFYTKEEAKAKQMEQEKTAIETYIKEKGWTDVKKTASGIHYIMTQPGDGGDHPTTKSKVKAHYKGTLLDGSVFDSSYKRNKPLDFKLSGVIKGWQEAIPMLTKGGKGTFLIPSALAYGERGAGGVIPPNAPLVFEIELVSFK